MSIDFGSTKRNGKYVSNLWNGPTTYRGGKTFMLPASRRARHKRAQLKGFFKRVK